MNRQNRNFGVTNNLNRRNNYPLNQQTSAPKPNNTLFKKNFQQNQYLNLNNNTIKTDNDAVTKALVIISNEFKKKDAKIKELEQKIQELQSKIQLLTNSTNSENNNNNYNMIIPMNRYKNRDGNDFNAGGSKRPSSSNNDYGYEGNYLRNNSAQRNNMFNQRLGSSNLNYNSDSEKVIRRKFGGGDNLSRSNDNSTLGYIEGQTNSKSDVKNYLKEVKSRVDSLLFKEFIKNIKLLTIKNNSGINKNIIIDKVRMLFGEEHKDLFKKFENIIGVK